MTQKQIKEAVNKAIEAHEDLNLWHAVEWMYSYGLMTYVDYKHFNQFHSDAIAKALLAQKNAPEK